ncbi:hypothetical protein [Chitinophaga sp.]|uniref:hypothetical protein n=1 Tax=Chitinophaga sp. TaxID=1869181 RepID=UPI00262B9164|nr:hypothetical protein [uncultured Chitinophaga sp.]
MNLKTLGTVALFTIVSIHCASQSSQPDEKEQVIAAIEGYIKARMAASEEKAEIVKIEINGLRRVGYAKLLPFIIMLHESEERDVAAVLADAYKRARSLPELSRELQAWEKGQIADDSLQNEQLKKLAALKKYHQSWQHRVEIKKRALPAADTTRKYLSASTYLILRMPDGTLSEVSPTYYLTDNYKVMELSDSVPKVRLEKFE